MKTLCIADFDDTLILTDSLAYIMKREKWYLRPSLVTAGIGIIVSRMIPSQDKKNIALKARSRFKEQLLRLYYGLPQEKHDSYIATLRSLINTAVIEDIKAKQFDRIVIVSASETELIKEVIGDLWPDITIIANSLDASVNRNITLNPDLRNPQSEFTTCYGKHKVSRLTEAVPDLGDYDISVYTDSLSDKPLIDLASSAYMVGGTTINRIK